ncbi:MAG: hypothetical protein GEV11_23520 [Streptosporangiales bacterium]|nr:hypothetical protein [Streptosporangiales bacterium]
MPVLVDWLTLVLAPVGIVFLVVAFRARRTATNAGESMPGWGTAAQVVGMGCLLIMVLLRLVWGE